MENIEQITLWSILMATQNPIRKYMVYLGRLQVIGFTTNENYMHEGAPRPNVDMIVTVSDNAFGHVQRTLIFPEQHIRTYREGTSIKIVNDAEGCRHILTFCTASEVPNSELLKFIQGN